MHEYGHLGVGGLKATTIDFEMSADTAYADAKYKLGRAVLTKGDEGGESVFHDDAAERQRTTSYEEDRAWELLKAKKYQEAAPLFEQLAARGSSYALLSLGWIQNYGHLGAPDPKKAISLWEEAARMGNDSARFRIAGTLFHKGDRVRARALYLQGAVSGHTPCLHRAGKMLVRGHGGPADREAGVALLTRAANNGHVYARRELLRLEFLDARSMLERLRVRVKLLALAIATFRRAVREPDLRYSDDIR
jgi:TPR repeat protein